MYSMEWSLGAEFRSGVLEWSGVKFWSGKSSCSLFIKWRAVVCVCVCVCVCVRACVHACVRACVRASIQVICIMLISSYDIASGSEITPCNKIDNSNTPRL